MRISFFLFLLLSLAAVPVHAQAAAPSPSSGLPSSGAVAAWGDCGGCLERVEWERSIADYRLVMLSALRGPAAEEAADHAAPAPILRQRFELRQGGQIMLVIEDRWLDPARRPDLRLPPPGTDVAGTGRPQVVLLGWSGDGECCYTLHVIELGALPRILARVATHDGVPRLVQRDADPDFEIIVEDPTYASWAAASDMTAQPRVVLKFDPQAERFRFAAAQMRRPPPPAARLEAEARLLLEGMRQDQSGPGSALAAEQYANLPPRLVRTMLKLIYTGNYPMARLFLDEAWSDDYGVRRDAFLKDLMECQLPRSPYWVDIATMNGLTPQAPRADCAAP